MYTTTMIASQFSTFCTFFNLFARQIDKHEAPDLDAVLLEWNRSSCISVYVGSAWGLPNGTMRVVLCAAPLLAKLEEPISEALDNGELESHGGISYRFWKELTGIAIPNSALQYVIIHIESENCRERDTNERESYPSGIYR